MSYLLAGVQELFGRYNSDIAYFQYTPTRNDLKLVSQKLDDLEKESRRLRQGRITPVVKERLREIWLQMEFYQEQRNIVWKQRAKQHWYKDGDRNSAYFHAYANVQRKKNHISHLRDGQGVTKLKKAELEKIITDYFGDLFSTTDPRDSDIRQVVGRIRNKIPNSMIPLLSVAYTSDEVRKALKTMHPFKISWTGCGRLDISVNHTFIVLLPKIESPTTVSHFRPISLCNIIYKLASKCIANRMRSVLPFVIFDSQSAFIPGRLITDNVLIAFETHHYLKRRVKCPKPLMSIKLDMSKAFDRVEWKFVKAVMIAMNFPICMVNLIMSCVTTAHFSFLLNGSYFGDLKPQREIRQGDPLSPYMFIICSEVLSCLLQDLQACNNIHGIKIARTTPSITDLFFTDDTLLLGRATLEEATHFKHAITLYERVSGQLVNYDKSGVMFSPNMPVTLGDTILNILGMTRTQSHGKYLGLPSISGRSKRDMFLNIIDRVHSKIENWNGRILSKGGKEVLIKFVLQAIPSYSMSCFKFPAGVIEELTKLIRKFWWGPKYGENKFCWVSWRKITQKKSEGGLDFWNLESFNLAFLAKQDWCLLLSPNSLLAKVLKARYFPNTPFLQAVLGSSPSFTWRGICAANEYLIKGLGRSIYSGFGTNNLMDEWISGHCSREIVEAELNIQPNALVADIIDHEFGTWKADLITHTFSPDISQAILAIPLGNIHASDKWVWRPSKSGKFTVKTAYDLVFAEFEQAEDPLQSMASQQLWNGIWKLVVPPKIIHFVWRCIYGSLPFADTLARRGVIVDDSCPFCDEGPRTAHHLFFYCSFASSVWRLCNMEAEINLQKAGNAADTFSNILGSKSVNIDLFCIASYLIWFYRNRAIFEGIRVDDIMIHRAAVTILTDFSNFNAWPERFPDSLGSKLWKKPHSKVLHIFFDGAISPSPAGGTGVFVTDETGRFIHGACKYYVGVNDAHVVEMHALRDALRLALHLGLHSFSLIGDSQTTILIAIGESHEPISCTSLLDDIKALLLSVAYLGIFWVRKSENIVAHELAFHAKNTIGCNESWSSIPEVLLSIRTG